jgi:hypothetical protein
MGFSLVHTEQNRLKFNLKKIFQKFLKGLGETTFAVFGLARNGGVKPPKQTRRSPATIFLAKSFPKTVPLTP